MKKNKANSLESPMLRPKAEAQLKARELIKGAIFNDRRGPFSGDPTILKLNYELEINRIELELQNEELRLALSKADTAIALYDFSPVGYFTLENDGTVCQMNLSGARMLGKNQPSSNHCNIKPFVSMDTLPLFNCFLLKAFETNTKQSCEVKFVKGEDFFLVHIDGIVSEKEQKCYLTALDITALTLSERALEDRKLVEIQALEQKQFFEQMFSQSSVSTQILDKEGWCEKINPQLSELFGVKPEDIEGKKYNIFHDESLRREGIIPILQTVFNEGKTATWDVLFDIGLAAKSQNIKVDDLNRKRWFHNWAYPIFEKEGQLAHVIIQHTDITARKMDEQLVNNSEVRYRRLFESAKDGILILDAENGQIVDVNPYLIQMLGYSHPELLGKELWQIGIFKNSTDSKEAFIELQDKGYIRFDDMPLETKYGKRVNVEFVSNVYKVDQKKVIQCNIRDITERLQAEKEIYTLGKAIEQGPSSIVITNAEGKIEFVNNKFTANTQYHLDDVKGKSPRIFNPGRLPENEFTSLWQTLKDAKTWEGEVLNRKKDLTTFWEEVSISAVKTQEGTISNYILIQNDISEKKQIMTDLIEAKEKAVESDRLKSAFLANMSHEIRTPLNSIIGFSELMSEADFDLTQLFHFTQIIHSSGNKLLSIISDIMDLSKIEVGEVVINNRSLSVNQLIIDIQKEYTFKAIEKAIELKVVLPDTPDFAIESDENKLRQILINFVSNAIKFTDRGFIEIGAKSYGEFILFHIKDTGIGIPAEFQAHIFERFRQVESAYTRKHGGNGLGLAISKALIELLGGKVWMETEPGVGSTFYFTIPIISNVSSI